MAKTRRNRQKGAGYAMPGQWFGPNILPPTSLLGGSPSTAPTQYEIRPVLSSTFQAGGKRSRKHRGGFAPSIMGSFVANAQAAVVPLAMYLVYHTMVPKLNGKKKGGATRRHRRHSK